MAKDIIREHWIEHYKPSDEAVPSRGVTGNVRVIHMYVQYC